jgi:exopolyphosphatase/guanosine-5'-triphosphate,3'-diphosphate pyrophosphatase
MGSNSFRLELGRVEGDQIFRLDTWRETIRIAAHLDAKGRLTTAGQRLALACLGRFAERLRGLDPTAVRCVATNTFRVALNAGPFLEKAEGVLGFPIDVIGGHEEARLIYLGVGHVLPASPARRLVLDIGGGSTEFIIGRGLVPERLESLKLGCVTMSQRFFPDGRVTARTLDRAETHARADIEAIAADFSREHWQEAYASSGTALALAEILESNGLSSGGITPEGLARLRKRMIAAGSVGKLRLEGLKPARVPVLAGGFAVMVAAVAELGIARINPVGGALRLGALYDLHGRSADRDVRVITIESFLDRYRVDRAHAQRTADFARALYRSAAQRPDAAGELRVAWAALLHEVGLSISHVGFHKHGAYILENADMPGFSSKDQRQLAALVLGCRGKLAKMMPAIADPKFRAELIALRLSVLMHHARRAVELPRARLSAARTIQWRIEPRWLKAHPLTAHLLEAERAEWRTAGFAWKSA